MKKVIRDGKVAVLFSPGFGAGWYTWNINQDNAEQMIFDPVIVDILITQPKDWVHKILEYVDSEYPDCYAGGINDLCIDWIPVGTKFHITEYDGNERIETELSVPWLIA